MDEEQCFRCGRVPRLCVCSAGVSVNPPEQCRDNRICLPAMRVTDPHGIGFDTTALDIELANFDGKKSHSIRVWLVDDGLLVETNTGTRLRIEVKGANTLLVKVED